MELVSHKDIVTGTQEYVLKVTQFDLVRIKLFDFDHLLFEECEKSKKISDKLLALELLARRVEGGTK